MTNTSLALVFSAALLFAGISVGQNQNQQPAPRQNPFAMPSQTSQEQRDNFPSSLLADLEHIKSTALADNYAYRIVAHLTENIGPRPSGSAQAKAAVEYVADEMRKLGLDVHLEEVKVPHWVRGAESAELVEYAGQAPGTSQKIVLTALGGSPATPADGLTADVIVVSNFDELSTLGHDKVAGKIVLFNELYDKQKSAAGFAFAAYGEAVRYRAAGPKIAADMGAAAALVRSVGDADFRLPHTGFSFPASIPYGAVTAEDADLMAHLTAQGTVRMHLTLTPQKLPDATSYNVIGDLKGSEHPEQVVVMSGHLDSWDLGTGAIDDAAGIAVAMQAAEVVQKLQMHPKRTLRVIAWMDEENGGSGSQQYTKDHSNDFPNHVGAIESDSGAAHPLGFEVRITPHAAQLLQPAVNVLQSFGATVMQATAFSPGADISAMSDAGVPAFGVMQDGRTYFHYHHTAADTLDKIVPSELRENAAAMAVIGYAIASIKDPLPR